MTDPLQTLLENINITEAERIRLEREEIILPYDHLMKWLKGDKN